MKNAYLLLFAFIILASCKVTSEFPIGTREQYFRKKTHSEVVEQTGQTSIYKKEWQPFGRPYQVRFYYFQNGYLTKIDQGVRQPDIIVQHQ
jgi:hypothetical protein